MNATTQKELVEEVEESRFPIYPTLMTLGNAICGLGAIGLATKPVASSVAAVEGSQFTMGMAEARSWKGITGTLCRRALHATSDESRPVAPGTGTTADERIEMIRSLVLNNRIRQQVTSARVKRQ